MLIKCVISCYSLSLFNRCIPESIVLMAKALASSFTNVLGRSVLGKGYTQVINEQKYLSRGMRFPTMWHFDMCRFRRASASSF